jgi:hypothetical protein
METAAGADEPAAPAEPTAHAAPRLPNGTQVVLRVTVFDAAGSPLPGATGRVAAQNRDGRYRVALADGRVVVVRRDQLAVRREEQRGAAVAGLEPPAGAALVRDRTIHAAVVGSRAFGLAGADSDVDVRGIFVAPTQAFWSLAKPPAHVDGPDEHFAWEVERFCELALKANPNLLEVLHPPLVVTSTAVGDELVALRGAFLSQLVYQTYSGYVLSQFKRIEADLRRDGVPKWKHVMHLLRLLVAVRDLLATGTLTLDAGAERDRLLAVRAGEAAWADIERWRLALHAEVDAAFARTDLPPGPDTVAVDAWLRELRARDVRGELFAP